MPSSRRAAASTSSATPRTTRSPGPACSVRGHDPAPAPGRHPRVRRAESGRLCQRAQDPVVRDHAGHRQPARHDPRRAVQPAGGRDVPDPVRGQQPRRSDPARHRHGVGRSRHDQPEPRRRHDVPHRGRRWQPGQSRPRLPHVRPDLEPDRPSRQRRLRQCHPLDDRRPRGHALRPGQPGRAASSGPAPRPASRARPAGRSGTGSGCRAAGCSP